MNIPIKPMLKQVYMTPAEQRVVNNPQVQLLIKAFDCDIMPSQAFIKQKEVAILIERLIKSFGICKRRVVSIEKPYIFQSQADISTFKKYFHDQDTLFPLKKCPF